VKKGIVSRNTYYQGPYTEERGHALLKKGMMLQVTDKDTLVPERPWKQIKVIKQRKPRWFWYAIGFVWKEPLWLIAPESQGTYDPYKVQRMQALKMQRESRHLSI